MLRCYGRTVVGWTEAKQRDLFAQHGVKSRDGAPIYFDTAGTFPRQRKAAIASLHAGAKDELGIARLYVLASNRKDLREVLADIKSKGATIRELATGRVLHPDDCADAILDAVNWWGARTKTFGNLTAAEAGELGKRTQARVRKKMYVPKALAWPIWSDKTLSTEEALRRINAIPGYSRKMRSLTTAYRHYGKREAFAGRRPDKKD